MGKAIKVPLPQTSAPQGESLLDLASGLLRSSTEYSMIGKDLDGTVLLWNEGARRIYGYEPDEIVGRSSGILHVPEDVARGKPKEILEVAAREGKWEGRIERLRKDGRRFPARVVVTPRKAADGAIAGFLLMSKDLSNELRYTASRSRMFDGAILGDPTAAMEFITNILQSSTEYSVVGKDLEGRILLWNEGARRIYGYDPEEVVGKANAEMLHVPQDIAAGRPRQIMEAALKDGKWEGTLDRRRKDGGTFTARVVITPRRDSMGKPVGYLLISKDISDEIRLTDELKANQYYTRSLIESNIDALMTTDPLGVMTDVNQQMEALTGHPREALIGTRFKEYFTDPELAEEGIRRVLHDGKVTNYELTARRADGRQTLVSYNASTFRDAGGKLRGVFAAARDITDQKALEGQLRDSQAYNRGLIEASLDGLITVSPDGLISDVNEQMCRISGFSREELVGTPFSDYFADAAAASAGVERTFSDGAVTDYALTLARKDGRGLRVSFNASVFRDQAGAVRGIFASARDVTEQSGLQEQLLQERTYNRGLIETSLDGLITVDPMLVITDVNVTMCRMAGYERAELIGRQFPEYFTDPKRAAEGVRLTFDKGAVTSYELTLLRRNGETMLVSFNAAVYKDQATGKQGIFAAARDITEQSRLQDQLLRERTDYRGLIEAMVDGLVTVDEQLIITDVNAAMCRMLGRSRKDLVGTAFTLYVSDPERAQEGRRLTLESGSLMNFVLNLVSPDGRQIPVSFNAATFRDTSGTVRLVGSARDFTEQKQLEEQLNASQAYTRSLIESNIDALMTTDPLGIITDVNQQMESLTGSTRAALVGTPFKTCFTDPVRAEEGIRQVLRGGKVTNYELTARAADGRETTVSYNATTFFDRDGKLQGVFAAARDITAHKGLEQQLRDQQTYLRGLIESSVDGLITVDPDLVITDVNDRMCQMAGYSRDELLGTRFVDYFTDPELARAGVEKTFGEGYVTEYALTLVSRTRRLLQVSFNASVFKSAAGTVRGIFASARDITDRVRLEEQMREQQTYLRGLIESSVDGLVTVDPQGFITDVNEQMCRMSGYPREQLIGSPFKQYFTNPAYAEAGVRRTLAEGVVRNYDLVLKSQSGRKSTVSFNASVFRAGDGSIQGIFASARDVSEQARLQGQLAEQQAYNRSLIEASADALFAIAPDGTVTDVNEEATRLSGYSRKHLVNSRFAGYFTDPALAGAGVAKTLQAGRVIGYELVLVTRHGRRVAVSFNAGVFADRDGKPAGILAAARDITAQKGLEDELRSQQFYTRSLIESNIDALMTTDPLGVITDVNEQMEALTGRRREELVGSPFKTYFTDPATAEEGIRLVLGEGRVTNYELTARRQDGHETVVSYNATTFNDQDGKLQGVFAAARDITERKRFERAVQEKNIELENASLAKDRFLASMSHELRTPLNSIIGFTGTLLMKLPGPLTADQEKQLRTIQSGGRHLLSLINDLLDMAKIESGKVELDIESLSCKAVIDEVSGALRPQAEAKGLALTVVVPAEGVTVRADRRALSQIVINLVNNAIKFTEKGEVRIELRPPAAGGGKAELAVIDSGVGMRAEDQPRLFEAFSQLQQAGGRRAEGTGLGLHLSQKLAAMMSARIRFSSEYGRGSEFVVELPT